MAGIGFELKKIYGRKTLVSSLYGTFYAMMSTVGPMLLSILLMILLKLILNRSNLSLYDERLFISSTTYAFIIAMLFTSFLSSTVSRYIADCIYLGNDKDIGNSAFGVMIIATVISGIVMGGLSVGMWFDGIPVLYISGFYLLGVLAANVYSIMTYSSALKHYRVLALGFISGGALAVGFYYLLSGIFGIQPITSAMLALVLCYFVILFVLVLSCVRDFGWPEGGYFSFLTYFKSYPRLSICSSSYVLGLYLPTIVYWFLSDISESISVFSTVPIYDISLWMAIMVNVPSLVIFVVKVETSFYDKYALYVSVLNNGTLDSIQKEHKAMVKTLHNQLFFVYEIQLIITMIAICVVSILLPYLNVSIEGINMFVLLSFAIYVVFCMYFTIVAFYYFSDYVSASIPSVVFMMVSVLGALVSVYFFRGYYALPLIISGMCGWIIAFILLKRRMKDLDSFLMC